MDEPLSIWYCDSCGEKISLPGEGYVLWKSRNDRFHAFRVVHQDKCDDGSDEHSLPLAELLGPSGLTRLISWLSAGPILSGSVSGQPIVANFDEYADLLRRLHVPYYEQARQLFQSDDVQGAYADANEVLPYLPAQLQEIIRQPRG